MARYLILDYYIDEPACFGVPPFISPYVRYCYGAIKAASSEHEVDYLTIDELRLTDLVVDDNDYGKI